MRRLRQWSAAFLLAPAACTHLQTVRDIPTTNPNDAVAGAPYAIPALQYRLAATRSITSCPKSLSLIIGGRPVAFSDAGFALTTKVDATAEYVPGEWFVADYSALASPFKTTSYSLETYPNGLLKSINVSAEDQSGAVVKDLLSTALTVVGLATGGVPALGAIAGPGGNATAPASLELGGPRRGLDGALRALARQSDTIRTIVCMPAAEKALAAKAAASGRKKQATAELKAATAAVMRLTRINADSHSTRDDLLRLDGALEAQDRIQTTLDSAIDEESDAGGGISVGSEFLWHDFAHADGSLKPMTIPVDANSRAALAALIRVATVRTISRAAFADWWNAHSSIHDAFRAAEPTLAGYFGVDESDVVDSAADRSRMVCAGDDAMACLDEDLTQTASVSLQDLPVPLPPKAKAHPSKDHQGLFIRSPRNVDFTLCKGASASCTGAARLVYRQNVSAPQFGQLRYLAFRNRMFEASQLTLSMREDGTVEKLDYKGTKAVAAGAAASAKDAFDQISAFRDKQQKAHTDNLAAARAEQVAEIQQQIDVLAKKGELIKAQAALQPDALQTVKDETSAIETQTALLNAKLSQLKAEAALSQAAGPVQ